MWAQSVEIRAVGHIPPECGVVVDTNVLPAAASVPALTGAQPLRTYPSRVFVMAKGNLPSMSQPGQAYFECSAAGEPGHIEEACHDKARQFQARST